MVVERLVYLYAEAIASPTSQHERVVLTALCQAVKKAVGQPCRSSLTRQPVTFDELYAQIPIDTGTPTRPNFAKLLTPGMVLTQLQGLSEAGWVRIADPTYSQLQLTSSLFEALAKAYLYRHNATPHQFANVLRVSGGRVFRQSSDTIYCRDQQGANRINAVRCRRAERAESQYAHKQTQV